MKKNRILILLILALVSAQVVACAVSGAIPTEDDAVVQTVQEVAKQPEIMVVAIKFVKVMFWVMVSSFGLFLFLSLWNFIVGRSRVKKVDYEANLHTPQTVDEAILFFIHKNKLK